jgi:RNA polymerase sigma-70 factor, ECF subfamily
LHPNFNDDQPTPLSLLEGIRCQDESAWQRLVDIFTPFVFNYCRRRGLSTEDAEDLSQSIMVRIYRGINGFRRDQPNQRFRYWVATIIRNEFIDYLRGRQDRPVAAEHNYW